MRIAHFCSFLPKIINIRNHTNSKLNNFTVMCLHVMWSAGAGERKNVSQSEKDQESQWSHRGEGRKENSNRKKIKSQLLYKATVITSTRALVVLLSTIVALHCQQPARVIPMGGNHHLLLVFVIAWWMSGKSLFPLPHPIPTGGGRGIRDPKDAEQQIWWESVKGLRRSRD